MPAATKNTRKFMKSKRLLKLADLNYFESKFIQPAVMAIFREFDELCFDNSSLT